MTSPRSRSRGPSIIVLVLSAILIAFTLAAPPALADSADTSAQVETTPAEPEPADVEPAPAEPEPAPVEPAPVEPAPAEEAPEPAEPEPADVAAPSAPAEDDSARPSEPKQFAPIAPLAEGIEVTVPADMNVEATGPTGALVTFQASAPDDFNGRPVPVTCLTVGDAVVNPAGHQFAIGTHEVICSALDRQGNTGSASFTVTVEDTTAPTIIVPELMTLEATGPDGAPVVFDAYAEDLIDGRLEVRCELEPVPSGIAVVSGDTLPLGLNGINCVGKDSRGNDTSETFIVIVDDTTDPTVTVPENITVEATSAEGAAVGFETSAYDLVHGNVEPSCSSASGATYPIGVTTVTCTASDPPRPTLVSLRSSATRFAPAAVGTGSASFTITVVEAATGVTPTDPDDLTDTEDSKDKDEKGKGGKDDDTVLPDTGAGDMVAPGLFALLLIGAGSALIRRSRA